MRKRHWIAIVAGLIIVAGTIAGATQSAAIPLFNSRGTIQPFKIHDHGMGFKMKAKRPIDVAVVGARLDPAGKRAGTSIPPTRSSPSSPAARPEDGHVGDGECVRRRTRPARASCTPPGRTTSSTPAAPLR